MERWHPLTGCNLVPLGLRTDARPPDQDEIDDQESPNQQKNEQMKQLSKPRSRIPSLSGYLGQRVGSTGVAANAKEHGTKIKQPKTPPTSPPLHLLLDQGVGSPTAPSCSEYWNDSRPEEEWPAEDWWPETEEPDAVLEDEERRPGSEQQPDDSWQREQEWVEKVHRSWALGEGQVTAPSKVLGCNCSANHQTEPLDYVYRLKGAGQLC
jgi:hypothetical protein